MIAIRGQLGGAVQAAVDAVANEGSAALSVADAGTKEAFLDAWTRKFAAHARYLRAKGLSLDAPVVVVYVNDSAKFASGAGWDRQPMLGAAPTDRLTGMFAVATADIGGYAHPTRFKDTSEITDQIRQLGLASALTVALMSTSELVTWPHGIDAELSPYQRKLDDAPVVFNLSIVTLALDQFYELVARQTTTWWLKAGERITVPSPEGTVQNDLWLFLLGKYSEIAKVKCETRIGNGRSDLTIDPLVKPEHQSAVLELKVTRDVRTPEVEGRKPTTISLTENVQWAISGVQQTAAYRDDEGFDGAFLCVYDFCASKGAKLDTAIQGAANKHGVIAKRYWITASHKEHREERYAV
ncbi:MAG: hypothetical protein RBU21_12530 [FCB group bacterium]|jgi:hypothetical protein|nr:hypothetical protein [FCB group bacterium]